MAAVLKLSFGYRGDMPLGMNIISRTLTFFATAALLSTACTAMAQGMEGALDAEERMNSALYKRNAAMLERGQNCSRLSAAGMMAPGAMAQFRCILANTPGTEPAAATPATLQTGRTNAVTLGPKPPKD